MKNILSALLISLALFSCNDGNKNQEKVLPESGGTINNLVIVTTDDLWKGKVGDATRETFATLVNGLPQDEPMFDLKQMLPRAFHEYVKRSRTFVEIELGKEKGVKYVSDVYASPQTGIIITGQTKDEIVSVINDNASKMVDKLRQTEIDYQIFKMDENPFENKEPIQNTFNIDLSLLYNYSLRVNKENFMWLRKKVKNQDLSVLIYELPKNTIKRDSLTITNIVKMRDSIGKKHIPGPNDGSYMITENKFSPFMKEVKIDGMDAIETRGKWDVEGDWMAGPFVNYIINDDKNNRQIVIEGFTYAPQIAKRDFMFELEAVAKSLKIK